VKKIEPVEFGAGTGLTSDNSGSSKSAAPGIVTRRSATPYQTSFRNAGTERIPKGKAESFRSWSAPGFFQGILGLPDFLGCKSLYNEHATLRQAISRSGDVLPQTLYGGTRDSETLKLCTTRGLKAGMALSLQVVSSHLLGVSDIERVLSAQPAFASRLCPHVSTEAEALRTPNFPRVFLLDGCSIVVPLGPLSSRLRANSPGSKFLALLAPEQNGEAEMIRLFHWGIDGMLVLDEEWKSELPKAIVALLSNRLWVPSEVLLAFVKVMKTLLDRQLLPGQSLTARESQVLQLLFRSFTNKEIACGLNISERTAKFHVCNVLNKLGLDNRRHFIEAFGQLEHS